jgi:hypothetical protein
MMPSAMKIDTRTVPPIVIPAKAGIHGFDQSAIMAFLNTGPYLGERETNGEYEPNGEYETNSITIQRYLGLGLAWSL